uniref:HVA22-like protein n=1 Tax=Oryza punctata TaxID=4537 RepID=A0A0E0MCN1_ORYPU
MSVTHGNVPVAGKQIPWAPLPVSQSLRLRAQLSLISHLDRQLMINFHPFPLASLLPHANPIPFYVRAPSKNVDRGGVSEAHRPASGEMLGELISKVLLVLFGYAMPAFECFKTLETRPDDAHMLRFWCQYWIIVSMVIACESFVSWMPMYGEIKLAFFVYLWYPKTKGSDVVYDSFIRPTVMQYEPNIEQRLEHLRANSGQLIAFYIKNFADKGTAFFMDFLRYVVSERPEAAANSEQQRSSWSSWNPFASRRPEPSPPPQPPRERRFSGADPDEAPPAIADVFRSSLAAAGGAMPRRPHNNNN